MAKERAPVAQWTMDVTVFHAPQFGHRVVVQVLGKTGGWLRVGGIQWTGLGIPEGLLEELVAVVDGTVSQHLSARYGIQGTLPHRWAGEPGTT